MTAAGSTTSRRSRVASALAFAALFATVLGLVLAFELDPYAQPMPELPWRDGRLSRRDVLAIMMVFATLGALVSLGLARHAEWGRRMQVGLLLVTIFAGLNYFYSLHGLSASQFSHRHDTFHYLLGPRYYSEFGYTDLYACTLAELENWQFPNAHPVRDLHTYRIRTAGEIRALEPCEDQFSPERRQRWQQDLSLFTERNGLAVLRVALQDRGYNGPPFHAAVAGALADRIPLTDATHALVPMLDVAVICAMIVGVIWVFGWPIGLIFGLFFFTNAADRWAVIGGSFFRFPWMALLALSLAALHARRHATAGILLALSTLLNVFPLVFAAGIAVRATAETWRQRSLPAAYRRFFAAGLLTGLLGLGIGALPANGIDNYLGWWQNMELHNVERFQGFGVGLKFPFIFRGEIWAATDTVSEGTRQAWFHEVRPWYWALASLYIGLALAIAARTDDDVEAAGVLGFTLFFAVLGTVGYYFACAALMIIALHRRIREPTGAVLIALFFITSLAGHVALYYTGYNRFTYNTVISTGWALWLLLTLIWLTSRTIENRGLKRTGAG